jgi:hypothetical protein
MINADQVFEYGNEKKTQKTSQAFWWTIANSA